jgi:hypothetical protein
MEKRKKLIFITGLHNKPQGCGALYPPNNAAEPDVPKIVAATIPVLLHAVLF